jgi:hypothetical protein
MRLPKQTLSTLRITHVVLVASLMLSVGQLSQAQIRVCPESPLTGHWQGAMSRQAADVDVAFDFVCLGTELRASFTSKPRRVMEYPFDSAKQSGNQLELVLGGDTSFSGVLNGSELTGTFKDEGGSGTFHLKHVLDVQLPYAANEIVFKNGDVSLSGSLYIPVGEGLHPGIVML